VDPVTLHRLIDIVYSRKKGDARKEAGGVAHTLSVLCVAAGWDPDAVHGDEVMRVLGKSPEHFKQRNQDKLDLGLKA